MRLSTSSPPGTTKSNAIQIDSGSADTEVIDFKKDAVIGIVTLSNKPYLPVL